MLDLGCNEGFFCGEALRQGARRVVGIDMNDGFLERAAEAVSRTAEFRHGSWWDIPDEKFDVILFLSAIHYEPEQRALLAKLAGHLTPDRDADPRVRRSPGRRKAWQTVSRADGVRRYPTYAMLTGELLKPYATRIMGASVLQGGDPVPPPGVPLLAEGVDGADR